jgi:hypothetical protein
MLRRLATMGLLLGLVLGLATMASAYKYKKPAGRDCGKVSFSGGFGGPAPSNVPKNATPQIHTFIVRGKVSCAQAKKVMSEFEKSFNTPAGGSKGVSPAGWSCGYSKKEGGQECTNSSSHAVVANGVVYKVPKKKSKRKH